MFIVYKDNEIVYRTQDFLDAFKYARELSSKGYKSFITASSDRQLWPRPRRVNLFSDKWGDKYEKSF